MKSKLMILAFTTLVVMTSCNKITHIPFDYTYHSSVSIPAAVVPGVTETISTTIATNLDSILRSYGSKPDLLQSAKLSSLRISISSPPGQTFDALRSIDIYIVTTQGDIKIASQETVPSAATSLDLQTYNVELKPYLLDPNMTLKSVITTNTAITSATTINYDIKIHYEANLLKAL
jgi:hypothetical protein